MSGCCGPRTQCLDKCALRAALGFAEHCRLHTRAYRHFWGCGMGAWGSKCPGCWFWINSTVGPCTLPVAVSDTSLVEVKHHDTECVDIVGQKFVYLAFLQVCYCRKRLSGFI